MFGKKKERDKFEVPEEFDLFEEKAETKKNITDESYLDSLLDIVMGNHENDSPTDVAETDVVIVTDEPEKEDIFGLDLEEDDEVLSVVSEGEEEAKEISIDDILGDEFIIPDEEEGLEEIVETSDDSNAIEDIEDYIDRIDKEQNELLIDDSEEYLSEHEDIIEGLDKIVSGEDGFVEETEEMHEEFNDKFLENIFAEPEEVTEELHEEFKSDRVRITEDDEVILQKAEEELLNEKPKKKGFIKSLIAKFASHDDDEKSEEKKGNEDSEEIDYFDENKKLLKELDEEDEPQEVKKKKKKGKKEKQKKEPKKVKQKAPKDPELEEKVKISGKGGFLVFSLIVVIIIAVLAGGSVLSYKQKIKDATDFFVAKDYASAYKMVSTSNLQNTDEEFYTQLRLIMYVHRYYESYLNFTELGYKTKALDALIKGVGNYELYKDQGRDYNVMDEMQYSYGLVKDALKRDFNISETKALELSATEDRNVYSQKIYEIINDLE